MYQTIFEALFAFCSAAKLGLVAGRDHQHAAAIAAAVRESHAAADMATKADLELLRKETSVRWAAC